MIDVFFGITILIAVIKGYKRGLIVAVFSLIAIVVGIAAALKFSTVMASLIENHISSSTKWIPTVSFLLVFVLVLILVSRGGKLIEKVFEMSLLGWVNRLCGIILYALLYTFIFSVLLFYAEKIHLFGTATADASKVYPYLKPLAPEVIDGFGKVIPIFKDIFSDLEKFFEMVKQNISR